VERLGDSPCFNLAKIRHLIHRKQSPFPLRGRLKYKNRHRFRCLFLLKSFCTLFSKSGKEKLPRFNRNGGARIFI